jgi:hypothetical protein
MGCNDHQDADEDGLDEILRYLINAGELEGAALGVAKQIVGHGTASLSPRQQTVLEAIKEEHFVAECERCGGDIPLSEMLFAMDSGLCGWCEGMDE